MIHKQLRLALPISYLLLYVFSRVAQLDTNWKIIRYKVIREKLHLAWNASFKKSKRWGNQ